MLSPTLSYKFSEMLETHAVDTYGQFVDENEDMRGANVGYSVAINADTTKLH